MGRVKQKPITVIELSSSSNNTSNPSPAPPTPSLPTSAPRFIPLKPTNVDFVMGEASRDGSEEQTEPTPAADHSTPIPPTEPLLSCPVCNDTFPSSHRDQFREHVESCAANGLGNESDEESAALSTPPASDSNPADRFPSAYSNKVEETYPIQHEDDTEADEAQPKFRLAKLTDLSEFQDALDEAEEGTKEDHFRALQGMYQALVEYQDEWLDLDKVIKTSRYPNTISIEDELERDRGRIRGFIRDPIKPTQRVINPRAKPVRPDDPEKWYYTNQFQLDQDKTEAAVYGYIVKESARDIGHQDPIGQRPRGPGQNRDLRVRQPPRNTIGDGDSGDESGLNAVDDALLEGGRGKREKRPSNRVMGTNSRASSVDAKLVKQPRKNAKSRLAELEADPSAAENLDSTQRWANDVDAAGDRQPGDDSDSSEDEAGVAKPHKGPKSSYLDKPKKAAKKGKNAVDSINGELDDDEAEAAKKARSQKRSEGAKMGWAKRKEALAAKESSTQASINGDDDEGNRSELAKQEPNDGFDANSALKAAPKKKEKKMMQLADGTWIEKPSAATINMRRRWQKKREAEAQGLPPPKIGRYKKTDVPNASDAPTPAHFDDAQNNEVLAAVDRANSKRKQGSRDDSEQIEDNNQDEADKKGTKATTKRRKKNTELSEAMILDEDTVNDNTLELEDDDLDAQQSQINKGKRSASSELGGPPNKRARNPESLASSDEEDEATEFEDLLDPSSSPRKRKTTKGATKGTKKNKGTHKKKSQAPAVSFPNILRTTNRRTTPKLGSFVRRGSTAKPTGGGADAQGGANDEELENQTTEDERPPLSRFDSRPSGFSFEVDDLPPGHPLLSQAPIHGGPTFGPSFLSGPLNVLRNPPGPTSMGFRRTPSMGFFTPLEHLIPTANNLGSMRPMDPFLAPYTQSNPHPPVYSRTPSSDRVIPRPSLPGRNEKGKPSELFKNRASGSAGKFKAQALNPVDARDLELAGEEFKAPKLSENQDPGQRVRRSSRSRKAPVKREYVEPDSEDTYNVPSSPPKPRLSRKSMQSRPSNRSASRPSRIRNSNGRFEKTGMNGNEQDEYDDEEDYYGALEYNYMWEPSQAAPASNRYELDEDSGARSPASGQTLDPVRAEVEQHPLPDEDEDGRDASLQIARRASLAARGDEDAPGVSANPGYGGTTIPGRDGAPGGADVALPSRPKKPSGGLWTGKNWVDLGEQEHHTLSQDFPELDSRGLPIGGAPVLGKRVRKPARPAEAAAPPGPATGGAKRSSKTQAGSKIRKSRTSAPTRSSPSESPGSSSSLSSLSSLPLSPPPAGSETEKPSSSKAKSKGAAKSENPTQSNPRFRRETATPQQSVEPEQDEIVTGSERRPKRTIKPPRKYEDEGDIMEGQRERTPSGNAKAAKSVSPRQKPASDGAFIVASDPHTEPPASASKKSTKAKARKSDSNKDGEADSPVASIEDDNEMDSSQKTVVDPEVAEALAKREEARKAKSEKMKAITKARWASGEMHSVMEKKKANNAAKKAALTAGTSLQPLAIAPAPSNLVSKAAVGKKAGSEGKSRSPAPITPTLGTFTAKGKGKGVIKPEPKKEPRAKVLAKQEGNPRINSRARSTSMGGDGNASSDDQQPKKLSEYEIFQQLSSSANLDESDAKGTRARSLAYEGRRSGRRGSLGGVGMERTISDDGASHSRGGHTGTPTTHVLNRSKTLPKKMSEYEMFQQISSPSAAGSPLPPRGRRPAALRASQTFGRFNEEDEVEEETVPYAGPPGHVRGHSRTQSLDTSQLSKNPVGTGGGKTKKATPQVNIKEEDEDEDEDEDEEGSSDDDEPRKKTKYDEWQEIIRGNGETEEGKRTRMRKSDAGGGR